MAAADSREGNRAWEVVNETFGANPLCLGAGCGLIGGRELTEGTEGRGLLAWLSSACAHSPHGGLLIVPTVGLFPHLQDAIFLLPRVVRWI